VTLHHGKYAGIVQGSPRRTDTPTEIVSPFGDIGQVEQITAEEAAAVIWHVNRYATDARDAAELLGRLGLGGVR